MYCILLNKTPIFIESFLIIVHFLKDGEVMTDNAKEKVLCPEILSWAFDLPIKVEKNLGYFYASAT